MLNNKLNMKTVCIYHSIDLDGWMSAAIVKHWFINKYDKVRIYNNSDQTELISYYTNPNPKNDETLVFIGYNYGDPIPDLSEYDKVIMCDISFPLINMDSIASNVSIIQRDFIWIDHHISAIKECSIERDGKYIAGYGGIRDTNFAACELTWKYFFPNEPMPEIVRLLGRYDCFGHKGTNEELKVLEFQYGARSVISNYEQAYKWLSAEEEKDYFMGYNTIDIILDKGKAIYQYLCSEAEQIYKTGFILYLDETLYDDNNKPNCKQKQKFICINKERFNPINFGIDYHKDGYDGAACFHYANGMWNFSLYNDNGAVDCSIIAKQFGGGGHKGASGFRIDDINKIIK